jgi:hypothetical protein
MPEGGDPMQSVARMLGRPKAAGAGAWSVFHRWTTGVGFMLSVVLWGLGPPIIIALSIAIVGALFAWSLGAEKQHWTIRRSIDAGVSVGLTVVGLCGLVAVLGVIGLVVVLVLGATSPIVSSQAAGRLLRGNRTAARTVAPTGALQSRSEARVSHGVPSSLPADCGALDGAELAMAWRRSFVRLERATSRVDRLAVVELRQRYLDELYRRYPEGMASWLASGARASGNPLPYLRDLRQRPQ